MVIYLQSLTCDGLLLLLLVSFVSICITKATSILSFTNDDNNNHNKRADEYVMTSATIDGIKRSNVCGDGYRIEGALLKSYPYSKSQAYLPYENCFMTFKARRPDHRIRIRILSLDINDIRGGTDCLDTLRFYKSANIKQTDKLDTVECGQLNETNKLDVISPTGLVTAHFSTDGGNVSGLGFKVILTAFRTPNKTHPCDPNNEEYLCNSHECISNTLLCDGVPHCLDGSDEPQYYPCTSTDPSNNRLNKHLLTSKRQHWRGILIAAFLLIILCVFILFVVYFFCRRFMTPPVPLMNGERKTYATILKSPKNRSETNATTTKVIIQNDKAGKHLDDDYNLL